MRALARLLSLPLRPFSPQFVARAMARFANLYAKSRPAEEGLRFLMDLDSRLYPVQSNLAVANSPSDLHPKHRLTRYHDFFCARVSANERVLDIGCGVGALAHSLASRTGAKVTGIDLNGKSIAFAKERHQHADLTFREGDALTDLPGEEFDVAVLSNVLEHIEDRPGLLRKAQEMVRPKRWLIRVPLFERDWRVPLKREIGVEWRLDPTHFTEYTLESFHEEMAAAALEITHLEVRWGEIWSELRSASAA